MGSEMCIRDSMFVVKTNFTLQHIAEKLGEFRVTLQTQWDSDTSIGQMGEYHHYPRFEFVLAADYGLEWLARLRRNACSPASLLAEVWQAFKTGLAPLAIAPS